jgi:hypothetical protein
MQASGEPLIAAGELLTDIVFVAMQPVDATMYVSVAVPEEAPSTIPLEEPIVATDGLLLLQEPPPVEVV